MNKITDLLNLRDGEDDRAKTLEAVKKNITFKGANLWILACAIIVASVGLNVNSTAVIIGAMLISPLMGPIVGAGFALGIYDFSLLKKSLNNLLIATVVSLVVSTLYFYLSPFKDVQSELLARTSPNIYDILIAFFGGVVGVIAVTRSEKGNPIPGVAIATALMPPLCTAGYGLATAQWTFFLGAFYLYCINCVFIGIATFLIIKSLNYPAVKQVDEIHQKRVKYTIAFLITVMLVPSGYLAYSLYREQQFKKNVNLFIESEFTDKGYTIVYKKTDFNSKSKKLELAFLSRRFSKLEIKDLINRLNHNKYLTGTQLQIRQDSTDRFNTLKGDILNQIKSSENEMNVKDVKIMQLEKELNKNKFDNRQILKETRVLFPVISSLAITKTTLINQKDSTSIITAVIYDAGKDLNKAENQKLQKWLNERLSVKDVELFRKP
ncbi:DUF389 domain-containing protein [Flavobacterium psychroterrae]|uniref:DUF389 domain-containing protein n=1 Tax=Flavobacterium psychroterrae TaxID=2133767 RepID=A0ABS5PGD5_9FLAO|nr:DUF389 domain-containing protein [Flavobacterium psychroterrae]MBS7233369.1 DUF389 domain-containing protein [Flavobacterium psychroterrae]